MTTPSTHMHDKDIARETAKILIETNSILFNTQEPFTYTSGRKGPVYIDCRRLISFPRARTALMEFAVQSITENCGYESIDTIIGGETAGIPYAAFIADRLSLPMAYIRKKPKGVGRLAQIEGFIPENHRVLLVEDLQNYGTSQKTFIEAIKKAGLNIQHAFVLFNYGNEEAAKTMQNLNVNLHYLCDWWEALETAREYKYFDENTLSSVEEFLKDPISWSVAHGGKGEDSEDGETMTGNKRATL